MNEVLPPLLDEPWQKLLVIAAAYGVTLALSGPVVRWIAAPPAEGPASVPGTGSTAEDATGADSAAERRPNSIARQRHLGRIIGKCENVIAVTFVLAGQETGLALIFAGKSIVRREDIRADPDYFLGGTLVNLVWSLSVAFLARIAIAGL